MLVAGASGTGGALVLEQQQHLLDVLKVPDAEKQSKADAAGAHQRRRDRPGHVGRHARRDCRKQADTPWFASFLAFDPARPIEDARQPILIVQGELDTQVPPHHADKLAALARARKRQAAVDVCKVPGVNHLLVPAKTGEVTEYATLETKQVSPEVTGAIASWLTRTLGPGRP